MKNLNEAQTLNTELNVFQSFSPKIPAEYQDTEYLFLANIDPVLQEDVRRKMPKVKMVCGDTMNYWIKDHAENLARVLKGLDVSADQRHGSRACSRRTTTSSSRRAKFSTWDRRRWWSSMANTARPPSSASARFQGKNGSITIPFRAPALPLAEVVDPTGAGDSFAGGFFGYIASQPTLTPAVFRRAMFYGSVMGSFAVERFGTERLQQLDPKEIEERFALFRQLSHLE